MSELSSVNKIKSLKQQIEQVTGESHSDLTVAIQALKNGYGNSEGSGGSSGIIDVTELPTSNIDESAVYRLTESVQTNINEAYTVDYSGNVRTLGELMAQMGIPTVPNVYIVDELPADMKPSDVTTYTELNSYALKTDGKVYFYIEGQGIITMGMMMYRDPIYDRGSTDNVFEETEVGVYTTFETYKEVVRYFIRKNGEWEETSAMMSEALQNGCNAVDVLKGVYRSENITVTKKKIDVKAFIKNEKIIPAKVFVDILNIAEFLDYFCDIKEIPRECFYNDNGSLIYNLRLGAFAELVNLETVTFPDKYETLPIEVCRGCSNLRNLKLPSNLRWLRGRAFENCHSLEEIVIPEKIQQIESYAFANCSALATVTFKGKPQYLAGDTFMSSGVKTIYVPWAEYEVAGAPWSAYDAEIVYGGSSSENNTNLVLTSTDEYGDVFNSCGYRNGYKLIGDIEDYDADGYTATGYIFAGNGCTIRIKGCEWALAEDNYIYAYDSDYCVMWSAVLNGNANEEAGISYNGDVAVFETLNVENGNLVNLQYIRISCKGDGANLIVTRDEELT